MRQPTRVYWLAAVTGLLLFSFPRTSMAFHDGGVAYCDGCHTMHNSYNGTKMTKNALPIGTANAYLLQGQDQSSTCLICHAKTPAGSYHILTPGLTSTGIPANYTPGGDFGWLQITTSALATYGAPVSNPGERHGHNVIAADYGLVQDSTLTVAPGGSYSRANLTCISCHDPHPSARVINGTTGQIAVRTIGSAVLPIGGSGSYGELPTADFAVGVYRILGGAGYVPKSYAGGPTFTYNPPIAVAPSTYNRSESVSDTRVAYGSDVSFWCANCHLDIHSSFGGYEHPTGQVLGSTIQPIYNQYVKSGDLTGNISTSYTSMVPFQSDNLKNLSTLLAQTTSTAGPLVSDRVMCLSCHRAHASGFESITRWNNKSEFLTIDGQYPGTDAPTTEGQGGQYSRGYTQLQYKASMYDRPATNYAFFQRSLCNKCHAKD